MRLGSDHCSTPHLKSGERGVIIREHFKCELGVMTFYIRWVTAGYRCGAGESLFTLDMEEPASS